MPKKKTKLELQREREISEAELVIEYDLDRNRRLDIARERGISVRELVVKGTPEKAA